MAKHLETSIDVRAPAQAVWEVMVDWNAQGDWMLGTRVSSTGEGLGATLKAFTGLSRIGFLDVMTITRWEPPTRCDVVHVGRLVRGTGSFQVTPTSQTSARMTWIEDLEVPGGAVGRVALKMGEPVFMKGLEVSLRRFARLVESAQPA